MLRFLSFLGNVDFSKLLLATLGETRDLDVH